MGLVNDVVPRKALEQRVHAFAGELCRSSSSAAMASIKEMFARGFAGNQAELLEYAANLNAAMRMSADLKRGLEQRKGNSLDRW